jgi:hypothetical protein
MPEVNPSIALDRPQPLGEARWEQLGLLSIVGMAGALQFSIAIAQFLFSLSVVCWVALLITRRERF